MWVQCCAYCARRPEHLTCARADTDVAPIRFGWDRIWCGLLLGSFTFSTGPKIGMA